MRRPAIAITPGDPAGIGPEVALQAALDVDVVASCTPVIVASASALARCADAVGIDVRLEMVDDPRSHAQRERTVAVLDVPVDGIDAIVPGQASAVGGAAAARAIERACVLARLGAVDAIATGPIDKVSLRMAGVPHIGHTEMLAAWFGVPDPLTLFVTGTLRIFFLTRHLSLRQAIDAIDEARVLVALRRVVAALRALGFAAPRVALAALNPHAGDGGQFGDEERLHLEPAVARARAEGLDVVGPVAADSVFHQALDGRFDAVLSLYHDQGHIAAKTRDFYGTITATLGLPVLRTSVDHGSALDIAWQGRANPVSMRAAVLWAARMAAR